MPPMNDDGPNAAETLQGLADEIHRMRRARDRALPRELFGEPAWDMLLALYGEESGSIEMDILAQDAGVSQSVAGRWVEALEAVGLIARAPWPPQKSIELVALTADGRRMMEKSLSAMLQARRQ